ncbi:MAG: rhamnogalacturonan lyase [Tannerella sp.]|jgi:rhamnogalacturonan endolyase|nr:rhamnogalacturonan lyase [Tannerella sp.]
MKNICSWGLVIMLLLIVSCETQHSGKTQSVKIPNYSGVQKEQLGRGLVAVHNGEGIISISWRYLENDPLDIAFDLYRQEGNGLPVKLNNAPLTRSTFFREEEINTNNTQTYTVKIAGSEEFLPGGKYVLTPEKAKKPWISIPVAEVPGDSDFMFAPNDASVGDLDGDGEYELVVKREINGFDNSHKGSAPGPLLEAYKLDGTFMWRVDLGPNIRPGAHYTQFMIYDFDGDGKAEIAVRTSEGTVFGDGMKIGDVNNDGITDYVDRDQESRTYGKILHGPEFLSVIDGMTGKESARTDFIERGKPFEFGDNTGNRVDRFLGGAGYFDGKCPSILICRGYYAKTVIEAWNFRGNRLSRLWRFDTSADGGRYRDYEGQGNHNLSIGDVDGDGKDEITYGAIMIDHDGTPGYHTGLGHGDAIHMTDINIDRPGLEVWTCHESQPTPAGSEMRDARTGALLWGIPALEDVGRAMTADIDPRFRGLEAWTLLSGGVYTADGLFITETLPSVNMAIWWDGDLNRELLDRAGTRGEIQYMAITKWNGDGVDTLHIPGQYEIMYNNGTKGNPCLHADILGDWREELVVRTKDNREIRIYVTGFPTDYRFHTLMNDEIYRWSVLTQNIAYNQPTQIGRYLGSDLGEFWPVRYHYNVLPNPKITTTPEGRPNGLHARLQNAEKQIIKDIIAKDSLYTLDARCDYDMIEWTINGKKVSGERYVTLDVADFGYDTPIPVQIRATMRGCVFEDNGSVTFATEQSPPRSYWDQ